MSASGFTLEAESPCYSSSYHLEAMLQGPHKTAAEWGTLLTQNPPQYLLDMRLKLVRSSHLVLFAPLFIDGKFYRW